LHKDRRELRLTHLDLRPKFMWYEFEARTHDNVELLIGITFFWQIVDVERMLRVTDDTPGDLCSHARSDILQAVSQVPLERFLAAFNEIIGAAVLGEADPFYAERGVMLHAVEVRSVACKDAATQQVLQEIIQETTNRLNRLQQQASANEVRLHEMRGAIEAEALRGELMEVRRAVQQAEARIAGSAEGERVRALLEGLGNDLPPEAKLAIFQTLRKQDALTALSNGNARLYFTPEDVDLRIEG
jgi:regulator of protease activity HflC (stomatin/prohibitin superfamily)